jgi:hypothetical protein
MRLGTRLAKIETKLQAEDEVPGVVIVLEEDGVRHDCEGTVIDPATVDPRTQEIRLQSEGIGTARRLPRNDARYQH